MKKYKALLTDVDGTLIPNRKDGEISQAVTDAFAQAGKLIHIGLATSRDREDVTHLAARLQLHGPSILYGGAWIVDFPSHKILWKKEIDKSTFTEIYSLAKKLNFYFIVNDNGTKHKSTEKYSLKSPINLWGHGVELEQLEEFRKAISHISSVSLHTIPSWKEGKIDFLITNTQATKQHAIFEVTKLLNIKPEEIIAVGDGANDIPLLMSAGLKVAMGNAVDELKEIADYIAPSVEDNGLADVIKKFVL